MTKSVVRRVQVILGVLAIVTVITPVRAQAQITRVGSSSDSRQAIGFNIGYFSLASRGGDGDEQEVLFQNQRSLLFDIDDFNGASFGGEWLLGLTDYIEVGAGINYYKQTTPSIYRDLVHSDGTEIEQELKLRQVPIAATVRFVPTGRRASVQPYIGAGIGFINWRYVESGEFVDFNGDVFLASEDDGTAFVADGTEVGPVILGGIRFPVADVWLMGAEFRWQAAEGDTGGIDEGFLGDKIDLGGWSANFGVQFRF